MQVTRSARAGYPSTTTPDFAGFESAPIVNGRLVGRRHQEYVGFLPGRGTISIAEMGSSLDSFDARWSDPVSSGLWAAKITPGGAPRSFTAPADKPGASMWVLHVVKRSAPRGVWLDDTFDGMVPGPLHGQNHWVMEDRSPTVAPA